MKSDRFYCPSIVPGSTSILEGDEARHLAKVRRVPIGAEVELFDGRGSSAVARVIGLGRDRVELAILEVGVEPLPSTVRLTLGSAIPKGDRFDWLVEKATELGVERLVPLLTERSTVDPRSAKLDRLRRSIIEASKQSRRNTLMVLEEPILWERWVVGIDGSVRHRWLAHPGGRLSWTEEPLTPGCRMVAAIGPEGGFSDREVDLARHQGWETIGLTSTTLRVETAALALSAQLLIRSSQEYEKTKPAP